jgi:hypothetical protein
VKNVGKRFGAVTLVRVATQTKKMQNSFVKDEKRSGKMPKSENLQLVDKALMSIIEMFDTDTIDEQMDCIEALKKLRNKLKEKENVK